MTCPSLLQLIQDRYIWHESAARRDLTGLIADAVNTNLPLS